LSFSSFFFTVTASIEIYTLSLHDALPIFLRFCLSAPDDRWQRSHQPFSHQRPAASGWRLASALHRADLGDLTEAGSASVELRRGARALLAAVDAAVSGQLVVHRAVAQQRHNPARSRTL